MYFIDQSSTKNIYTFTGLALSTPILKTCGLCLPKSSTFSGGLPAGISWQNELTPNINNYVIGRLVGIATETGVFNSTVVFYGEYRGMAYPEGNTTREIIDVTITVQELPPPPPSVANFKIIDSITNEIIFETGEVSTNGSVISGEISMTTCDFHPCVHGLFGSWQYSLDGCGIKTISAGGVGNGCATETETETETDTETPTDTETESETETETLSNCSNCNLTIKFRTYTIPDRLYITRENGESILDTGMISTYGQWETYTYENASICGMDICVDSPNLGTVWDIEIKSNCGLNESRTGGQSNTPTCFGIPCPTTIANCASLGGYITYGYCECLEGPGGGFPDMIQTFCHYPIGCTCNAFYCEEGTFFEFTPASCCAS